MSRLSPAARITAITCALALPITALVGGAHADSDDLPADVLAATSGDVTGYQWMLGAVNAPDAQSASTGAGATVAVIDTGVDADHPDLSGQVVPGARIVQDPITGDTSIEPATIEQTSLDGNGHGSHVAGIVAADDDGDGVTGIAPEASVMPIHVFPRRLAVSEPRFWRLVADGIDFAVSGGADVINMSLGTWSSGIVPSEKNAKFFAAIDRLCAAVGDARAADTVVVVAAGNDGEWGNPESVPASCDGAFTVSALAPTLHRAAWSSYDAAVDVSAPGEDILSVDSTVADRSVTAHAVKSGTSMASPVVAGVAALVAAQHPDWTAGQIEDQLTSTAHDLGVNGRDPNYGFGVVDAAAAVGVSASSPAPQDFFVAWAQPSLGANADEAVVSWTTPSGTPVDSYTVRVMTDEGTTEYVADGLAVRADVTLPAGAWIDVTAHLAGGGEASTYPRPAGGEFGGGTRPDLLRGVELERSGDRLVISWDKPDQPDTIDDIVAFVRLDGIGTAGLKRIKIDQGEPFPRSMTVPLPEKARWYDAYPTLFLYDRNDAGEFVGARNQRLKQGSPALFGSRIEGVDRAGSQLVEVTGGLSELNAKRACATRYCTGERAVLVVDRGRSTDRYAVVYTSRGVFHQLVRVPAGTDALRVRVEGPNRLDSGPFVRAKVDR